MPYATKQRQAVLEALARRGDRPASARSLTEDLRAKGFPVGLATVYRQLDRLAETGQAHKVAAGGGTLYQYCAHPAAEEGCLLLRCHRCGRVEHLECVRLHGLYSHLAEEHDFQVDLSQTVLTGLCGPCAREETGYGER